MIISMVLFFNNFVFSQEVNNDSNKVVFYGLHFPKEIKVKYIDFGMEDNPTELMMFVPNLKFSSAMLFIYNNEYYYIPVSDSINIEYYVDINGINCYFINKEQKFLLKSGDEIIIEPVVFNKQWEYAPGFITYIRKISKEE